MWITGKEKVKGVLGMSSRESAGMGSQLGTVFEWRAVQGWRDTGPLLGASGAGAELGCTPCAVRRGPGVAVSGGPVPPVWSTSPRLRRTGLRGC